MKQRPAIAVAIALAIAWSLALLMAGCGEPAVPTLTPAPPAPKRVNLVDVGRGGSIVSRTAELMLELGAVLMIDGHHGLLWSSPQGSPEQTIVMSLPARARIDEIAVQVAPKGESAPGRIVLESSLDGATYSPLITFTPGLVEPLQTRTVTPTEVRYLRLSTRGTSRVAQIREFEVYGNESEAVTLPPLEGAWRVNGQPARFTTVGARTYGVIAGAEPIFLDGGTDGRTYRFAWQQGPMFGRAIITASPDARHLSGMQWHEQASSESLGRTWYGQRVDAADLRSSGTEVIAGHLRGGDAVPLYGLRFDANDQLIESESDATVAMVQALVAGTASRRFTLTAYELSGDTATDRRRAETRISSVRAVLQRRRFDISRLTFSTAGLEQVPVKPESAAMHALYNAVELRLDPPAAPVR